jgi:fibronectin type 3 domain-containing protein
VSSTAYVDTAVASTQSFYYVVTAMSDTGLESGFSSEVAVAIP